MLVFSESTRKSGATELPEEGSVAEDFAESSYLFSPRCPAVARQFGYLATQPHPVFSWQHFSMAAISRRTIVILCYPMGYEYTHSHRSYQHWADQLAAQGCLVIRFDYSSTGDSAGRELPDNLLPIWLGNIIDISEQARKANPDFQLCLAGLRLGATLAYLAAQQLQAEQLILWEPIVEGKRYMRELQALSKFAIDPDNADVEYTEFAGFLMSHATGSALKTINLIDLPLSPITRVLCVYREDANKDNNLTTWLKKQKQTMDVQCLPGYEAMIVVPHETIVPHQAIASIVTWLTQSIEPIAKKIEPIPTLSDITLDSGIQEEGLWYDQCESNTQHKTENHTIQKQNRLFAILTRPNNFNTNLPLVILLNSGAVHHVGPNRVYTHLARTIAESGLACLRMDIEGLGDSFKPNLERENHPFQFNTQSNLATAISCLQTLQLANEFIVAGICSGAHGAFHGALNIQASLVREIILINPLTFYWQEGMSLGIPNDIQVAHDTKYYSSSMRDPKKWIKLFTGKASTGYIVKFIKDRAKQTIKVKLKQLRETICDEHTQLSSDLLRVARAKISVSLLISESDPGLEIVENQANRTLKKGKAVGIIRVKKFEGANHTFSGYQQRIHLMEYVRHQIKIGYQLPK